MVERLLQQDRFVSSGHCSSGKCGAPSTRHCNRALVPLRQFDRKLMIVFAAAIPAADSHLHRLLEHIEEAPILPHSVADVREGISEITLQPSLENPAGLGVP